jgi:hypothetical protein
VTLTSFDWDLVAASVATSFVFAPPMARFRR